MPDPVLIDTVEALAALCDRLRAEPVVTVDTEFMRERTYWPKLCLAQVAGPHDAAAIDALADAAVAANSAVENIGARRLHTVMERLLEDISFTAHDKAGTTVTIDDAMVQEKVGGLAKNSDLSKFIL